MILNACRAVTDSASLLLTLAVFISGGGGGGGGVIMCNITILHSGIASTNRHQVAKLFHMNT